MIICVVGPTGVGKTKLSIELAKKYDAVVVNCDAMQVYRGLNIGTAKVTKEEMEDVPHLLFDICDVDKNYTVFDYQRDVRELLQEYKDRNIIMVGGTGLYLKAALYDYRFSIEEKEYMDYDELSNEELYDLVLKKDSLSQIHPNNRVRMIRFLNKEVIDSVPPVKLYNHVIVGLTTERNVLYDRINKRVDVMVNDGLLDEVKAFYDDNIRSKPLMGGIGYKELYEYFDGNVTLDEALDKIKQNSRHYAKRQYTFFNNQLDVNWFNVDFDDFNNTVSEVEEFIDKVYKDDRS